MTRRHPVRSAAVAILIAYTGVAYVVTVAALALSAVLLPLALLRWIIL